MKHAQLRELKSKLGHFYCYFKSDNILTIAEDKAVLPFIQVICDENYPNHFLLSVAVDYPDSERAVEVALWANSIKSTVLTEAFFISANGSTYTGLEAHNQFELEQVYPLDKMLPLTDSLH